MIILTYSVTDALLSEGKESSANRAKTGFRQNDKVSVTRSKKTCRKLYESVPIVQKKGTTEDKQELKLFKRYVVCG